MNIDRDDKAFLENSFNQKMNQINDQFIEIQDQAYRLGFDKARDLRDTRQADTLMWVVKTFGPQAANNPKERIKRFAEEAIELCQAAKLSKKEMLHLVEHIYSRPAGDVATEVGQVGISLLALCQHRNISADTMERTELERLQSFPAEYWQTRQSLKAKAGTGMEPDTGESHVEI